MDKGAVEILSKRNSLNISVRYPLSIILSALVEIWARVRHNVTEIEIPVSCSRGPPPALVDAVVKKIPEWVELWACTVLRKLHATDSQLVKLLLYILLNIGNRSRWGDGLWVDIVMALGIL